MRRLRTLPPPLLIECSRRLLYGVSAKDVIWRGTQHDRGALKAPVAAGGCGRLEEFVQRAHDSLDEELAPVCQMILALRPKPQPEPVNKQ